jgi:uncharacterized damage-inducible protein DinB
VLKRARIGFALLSLAWPAAAQEAYKNEYLWELGYCSKNVNALAGAIPAEKHGWRPGPGVRSISEALMHIAAGNFLLLDIAGQSLPADLYGKVEGSGRARAMAVVKRNTEMEKTITDKQHVNALVERSLAAVREAFQRAGAADLDKPVDFFGRQTTVRGVYLRMLAHINEHMGQLVAYARVNGIVPPWSQPAAKEH